MESPSSSAKLVLEAALSKALRHLDNLDTNSVAATTTVATLRSQLDKELGEEGMAPEQVVNELVRDVEGGILGSAGGRFFGWVIGGALPAALAADWLTSTWDQNAALYACAPAAAIVEEVAGRWLKDLLRLPLQASFALVSGCQMAHATCLATARHEVLARKNWDVEKQGLYGAPPIRLLCNGQSHGSVERAVRLLGLGQNQIIDLDTDDISRVKAQSLELALQKEPDAPTIVLLQAGDISTGSFDDFETLIPLAHRYGAWVHIDGAFGLWAGASPRYRHLIKGVEQADSWATDGHKWLNVPFDCGYAFIAHPEAHRDTMSHRAVYLTHDAEARDQMDWNPEWSRRARGFPSYAALRQLGRRGVAQMIDGCCEHARNIVAGVGRLPGVKVVFEPIINQGLLRFLSPAHAATEADHDRRTDEVIAAVLAGGEAFFSPSTWHGQRVMRVSVCNWRTSDHDVERVVEAFSKVLSGAPSGVTVLSTR